MTGADLLPPFDADAARRPMRVAHRGGNNRRALRAAIDAGVDWLETDVWWHFGRVVARHDQALWRLPVTHHRWRVGVAPFPALELDELVDRLAGTRIRLLLDLKGSDSRLPGAILDILRRRGAIGRAALCGQEWGPLDVARAREPGLIVFFSMGREDHVPAYLARLSAGSAPALTSISHRLLTAERVARLKERGVSMIAWTVNDPGRAQQLVSWGVDGITSDSLRLLAGLHPLGR